MRRMWLLLTALMLPAAGVPALAMPTALAAAGQAVLTGAGGAGQPAAQAPHARALLVCNGSTARCPRVRHFRTVQAAVDAARPGDWVLIWPGVYHEKSRQWPAAGVWVSTPGIHIRGLNRNKVIIDGSNGQASRPCPSNPALQDTNAGAGRDGIVVWKASGVTIENLTVCDYLAGSGGNGNEIWWNGGAGSGKLGIGGYAGRYLTATSMFAPKNIHSPHLAQYGIFVSNAHGPGMITRSYASNMADAAYYVGGCQRRCNAVLARDRGTNSALGFSGTNAGGRLVIRLSEFDHNRTGLAPNSLNNDDAPPPQDGRCPGSASRSCLVIEHNVILANNNANVPASGLMPAVGAGVEVSGGAYDTIRDNKIIRQGSWGVVTHDYPDPQTPPPGSHCQGGIKLSASLCLFTAHGNLIFGNVFSRDGFFGNRGNADMATVGLLAQSATPRNCFFANRAASGKLTSVPAHIERRSVDGRPCGRRGTSVNGTLVGQLICATGATGLGTCPPGSHYPRQTKIVMAPLPRLASMPHPCAGVPRNGFCRRA